MKMANQNTCDTIALIKDITRLHNVPPPCANVFFFAVKFYIHFCFYSVPELSMIVLSHFKFIQSVFVSKRFQRFLCQRNFFLHNSRQDVRIMSISLFAIEYAFVITQSLITKKQYETALERICLGSTVTLRRRNILFTISISGFGNTMRKRFKTHAFCFTFNIYLILFDSFGKQFC